MGDMMDNRNTNLWSANTPSRFWQCQADYTEGQWREAIGNSFPLLGLTSADTDIETILALTLGEGRFGSAHWNLSLPKKLYYLLKPAVPRQLARLLRRSLNSATKNRSDIHWPVDDRYPRFLWEVMRQLLIISSNKSVSFRNFWPDKKRFAFVLTHDIETDAGQHFAKTVADLEESLGLRSSFNFVFEQYKLDLSLINELRERGFEIGMHGLKHDGKLFNSRAKFMRQAASINRHLKESNIAGFRSPLTHRNPEWMQALDIEYDLSFFDTDPFEPIPGGSMSIWPFFIGHFVELPYTLVQDYTLTSILGESSPKVWLDKVGFIEKYHGLGLVNSHPDYLKNEYSLDIYYAFLAEMRKRDDYWHALPNEVVKWWRLRNDLSPNIDKNRITYGKVALEGEKINIIL